MTVYVLIRENQNEHGYVDIDVAGVFADKAAALAWQSTDRVHAEAQSLRISDEEESEPEWQVGWRVEEHAVS